MTMMVIAGVGQRCTGPGSRQNGGPIIQEVNPGERKWRMYLPLYNGLESLDIGVPEGDLRSGDASRDEAGGVLHFDSARGVCASRPWRGVAVHRGTAARSADDQPRVFR